MLVWNVLHMNATSVWLSNGHQLEADNLGLGEELWKKN